MDLYIQPDGSLRYVYGEEADPATIAAACGVEPPAIRRASHVEPTEDGRWTADMAPVGGPLLGPFPLRSEALAREQDWLRDWLEGKP
jgi:hypothetical protein